MIRTVAETGSTNADILSLALTGAGEGLWLRAERQTAGKGRQGRAWVSPAGNLYISTLVRVRPTDPSPATLALLSAVALEEAVRAFGVAPILKWPNDLLVGGAKLSGILLERAGDAIAVGIGVNLAAAPEGLDRAATSLAAQGVTVAPDIFAEVLAESFGRWLERWRGEGMWPVRERWLARAHPEGTALTARLADGLSFDGLFGGLDSNGALILRLADGATRAIHAGDVFLL
ncbi:biotin--[acetyl-CoA-carboxylase] ligase [Sphingomonas sp. ABOLE]|uniref:biotin--[acetyl-CoA-carboxylase] ligase n=1 Tax=Sphingomonas sp. ABOLE TaxID=1985878 RepID=UPI000F7E4FD1|nr:biotin--[acetyl-CoA-carboxylase] ligase [Sphingomonas sp. ABOLE]RSV38729.1 biotin--[acetyl-CoA-carboxylase] ligase [Sphingomonas sp. ABOLE]